MVRTLALLVFLVFCCPMGAAAIRLPATLQLQGSNGSNVRLGDFQGEPLALFVMSFQCGGCRKAMPLVQNLFAKPQRGGRVLGVVFGPPQEDLAEQALRARIAFPLVRGTTELRQALQLDNTPALFWLDATGRIRERFVGLARVRQGLALLQRDFGAGVVGLEELCADPRAFAGREVRVVGTLAGGDAGYSRQVDYTLGGEACSVPVTAWLPQWSAASAVAGQTRPAGMHDLLRRPLLLGGEVRLRDGQPLLETIDANLLETKER